MPPPPPPSKSYLLVLDDSSDDDDDDDYDYGYEEEEGFDIDCNLGTSTSNNSNNSSSNNHNNNHNWSYHHQTPQFHHQTPQLVHRDSNGSTITANQNGCGDDNEDEDYEDQSKVQMQMQSKKKSKSKTKKKKNKSGATKKNKKKQKKNQGEQAVVVAQQDTQQNSKNNGTKSVRFDTVQVQEYERCLGTNVVPGDGGWPLGISNNIVVAAASEEEQHEHGDNLKQGIMTVEEYETNKQERLRIRAQLLPEEKRGTILCASAHAHETTVSTDTNSTTSSNTLETRQWDYRYKAKNPLFGILGEEQRMHILLQSSSNTGCNSTSSSSSATGTTDLNNHQEQHSAPPSSSVSSSSPSNNTRSKRSGSFSFVEQYNETFTQVEVHHVRNELEKLRFQRTGEGHLGCTCRKLDVYLLPPNAGKKAHHRRMNVKKLKDELKKRHLLPTTQKTREELELILHDAVEQEPCCGPHSDCPCARNGIECQADVCNCWYDSHQTKEDAKKNKQNHNQHYAAANAAADMSVAQIQARCGNPQGMYAVDLNAIDNKRQEILKQLHVGNGDEINDEDDNGTYLFLCQPISPHTPSPPLASSGDNAAGASEQEENHDKDTNQHVTAVTSSSNNKDKSSDHRGAPKGIHAWKSRMSTVAVGSSE